MARRLSSTGVKSGYIEFVLSKTTLLRVIQENTYLQASTLLVNDYDECQTVNRATLLDRLNQQGKGQWPCCVKFEDIEIDLATKTVEGCHQLITMNVFFNNISDFEYEIIK